MTTSSHLPKCGFIESEDGSIEWGSTWKPGRYSGPEPICIEYRFEDCGAWIPFTTWTRDPEFDVCENCYERQPPDTKRCSRCGKEGMIATRKPIDHHDCDWIASEQTLYHYESGGDASGMPHVSGFGDPASLPGRIWIADGVSVRDGERVLSDADLLAMGYRRVHGPTPDPFADATEGETFYDERTGERVPQDDGRMCGVCREWFVEAPEDLVVVGECEADEVQIAGLYRPDTGWSREPGTWVCPLPYNMDADSEDICPKCSAQALADYGLHDMLLAWQADREGMPEQLRESLLDGVRERVDQWVKGYPEYRSTRVHEVFAATLAGRLAISLEDAHVLCEDAGYSGAAENGSISRPVRRDANGPILRPGLVVDEHRAVAGQGADVFFEVEP